MAALVPGAPGKPLNIKSGRRGRPRTDVCFEGCDVVVFFGNKGPSRSWGGRPSRAGVQPRGAGAPPGAPPRAGADVCFIKNEVIFSQEQRSLSLDRTEVRLQSHAIRANYSTGVLCCQIRDVSRIGPSAQMIRPALPGGEKGHRGRHERMAQTAGTALMLQPSLVGESAVPANHQTIRPQVDSKRRGRMLHGTP
jgi:hypothetical protein